MNINNFFDKANKVYFMGMKLLNKAVKMQEGQLRSQFRTSSDEQLESMAKRISNEGGSPQIESILHEEMRRRRMM